MGFLAGLAKWAFGGGGAGKVLDKIDEAILSREEALTLDAEDLREARKMFGPATGIFNQLVEAIARSVRPVVTYGLVGGLFGWWGLPDINGISPFYQSLIYLVFTFWFGGRAIMKDIPAMLGAIKRLRN
jgi:hypothetical protein